MPAKRMPERKEGFIPTLNRMGYMIEKLDELTGKFIIYCEEKRGVRVLDVGAAYGKSILEALKGGAIVFSNGMYADHLKYPKRSYPFNFA